MNDSFISFKRGYILLLQRENNDNAQTLTLPLWDASKRRVRSIASLETIRTTGSVVGTDGRGLITGDATLLDGPLIEVSPKLARAVLPGCLLSWLSRKSSISSRYLRGVPCFPCSYPFLYFLNLKTFTPAASYLLPPTHAPPPHLERSTLGSNHPSGPPSQHQRHLFGSNVALHPSACLHMSSRSCWTICNTYSFRCNSKSFSCASKLFFSSNSPWAAPDLSPDLNQPPLRGPISLKPISYRLPATRCFFASGAAYQSCPLSLSGLHGSHLATQK